MQELNTQRINSPHWAYACAYVTCDPRQSHMLYLTNDHRCVIWTTSDEMAQQWGGFRQSGTQGQHDYCFLCLEFKAEFQYCGVSSEITQITFYRVDFLSD